MISRANNTRLADSDIDELLDTRISVIVNNYIVHDNIVHDNTVNDNTVNDEVKVTRFGI